MPASAETTARHDRPDRIATAAGTCLLLMLPVLLVLVLLVLVLVMLVMLVLLVRGRPWLRA